MNQRQYTAIFAIGAKLLGSFRTAMTQANARLESLRKMSLSVGKSLLKLTTIVAGLGSALSAIVVTRALSGIFADAAEEAKKIQQRTAAMIADFMQLTEINKKGLDFAQAQYDVVMKQAEALGKTSVLHEEIYKTMAAQLAAGGVPPRQIKAMLAPMGELLVKARGVNATEQDAAELAEATVKAIHGKTRALQLFHIFVESKTGKEKKTYEALYEEILAIEQGYQRLGIIAKAKLTPAGQIQLAKNQLRDLRKEIGDKMIPVQAKLAEAFLKMLPDIKPMLLSGIDWLFEQLDKLVSYLQTAEGHKFLKDLGDAILAVGSAIVWMVKHWKLVLTTLAIVIGGVWALNAAMAALSAIMFVIESPIILVIAAIAALIAIIVWAIYNWESFKKAIDNAMDSVGKIPIIGPVLKLAFLPLKAIIKLIDWLINVDWANFARKLIAAWHNIEELFSKGWAFLKKGFTELGRSILEALLVPINKIIDGINTMIDAANKLNPFKKIPHVPTIAIPAGYGAGAGAGGGVAPAATAEDVAATTAAAPMLSTLASARERFAKELTDPIVKNLLMASTAAEVGSQGATSQLAYIESVMNRAAATGKTLAATVSDTRYYPWSTTRLLSRAVIGAAAENYSRLIDQAVAGSNIAKFATGNESRDVRSGGAAIMFNPGRGERFVAEKWTTGWIKQMQDAAAASTPSGVPPPLLARPMQFGGIVKSMTHALLGERGPEAVIPLSRGGARAESLLGMANRALGFNVGGAHSTTVHFTPSIVINGNATESEQRTLESRLRTLARDFVREFEAGQDHERRLSYQSTYG